jgi:LuxR family maltose regulon positive regulatory protein
LNAFGFSFRDQFSYSELSTGKDLSYSTLLLYNSSLVVLLHRLRSGNNSTGLGAGIELADQLIDVTSPHEFIILNVEAHLLRAQLHGLAGDQPSSDEDYLRALLLAQPEQYIAVFAEQGEIVANDFTHLQKLGKLTDIQPGYVQKIQAAFSEQKSIAVSLSFERSKDILQNQPIESLTNRELEVLRLMSEGLKYKEIAERLYISLNTVRTHTKSLYGKLNASNRTNAIETARQLKIL